MRWTDVVERTEHQPSGYSIRVTSRLTGISADKLRIWERRYGFPAPTRTSGGLRVYSSSDVERLVLIGRALEAGYRARDAIAEDPARLRKFLAASAPQRKPEAASASGVDGMLSLLANDDAEGLRSALREAVAVLGVRRFLVEVAAPLVEVIGNAWHAGTIGVRHEHLFSTMLSSQLRLLLTAYEHQREAPVVLLTTLPNEQHGLGLEMAALYLALDGAIVRLLGVDTPTDEIIEAALALDADVLGISISPAAEPTAASAEIEKILAGLPEHVELWLGGKAAPGVAIESRRIHLVTSWDDVDRASKALMQRGQQLPRPTRHS
jgi:MerR family transcriptional regulator, light-induced transcriptional regulator